MKKTSKFILVVGIVILILLASLIYQTFYKSQDTNEDDRIKVDNGMNLAKGNQEAKIIMIEFSDFQCPFCKSALPVIDKILNEYNVAFYYRNFPLSIHENSMIAAEAAECANEQGKFWQYHDILFANQDKLDKESLQKYAEQLNLNVSRFNLCFGSGKYKAEIERDIVAGNRLGVSGTPTFFINGIKIEGAIENEMKKIIEEELKNTK